MFWRSFDLKKLIRFAAAASACIILSVATASSAYAAGWQMNAEQKWEYYDEEGKLIKNQWIEEEGQKYYMDGNGVMVRSFPWLRPLAPFYQMFRYTRQVFTTKGALKSMLHGSGKAKKRASLLERLGIR